jgi:O-succinylbenzoate synthase
MTSPLKAIKFKIHRYQLLPRSPLNSRVQQAPREGALIRIQFPAGTHGYADCFPWPELGDLPIAQQLDLLQRGSLTPLTRQSLFFAEHDAKARLNQQNLFEGLTIPTSHFLMPDLAELTKNRIIELAYEGFRLIKIKVGRDPEREASLILQTAHTCKSVGIKLRLDFNHSLHLESLKTFLDSIKTAFEEIDFIEDPMPFDPKNWEWIQKKYPIRLAADRIRPEQRLQINREIASVVILKPATQNSEEVASHAQEQELKIVVTSYLDHPLGQLCAAWSAAKLVQKYPNLIEDTGLLSHRVYHPHPFLTSIQTQGPILLPPSGQGFGLGEQLLAIEFK